MADWLNGRRVGVQIPDYVRAKEILNIASFTNRGIVSSIDIYAEIYNNGTKPTSLTEDECKELAKETPFSYSEIKAVFYIPAYEKRNSM